MKQFVFLIISLIALITPLYKGLYFDVDFYPIHLIMGVLILLVVLYTFVTQKEFNIGKSWLIFLLPFILALTLFVAESPKGTVDEVLRWVSYSLFFCLLYWTSSDLMIKKYLVPVIQFSGVFISVYGLLGYTGIVQYAGIVTNERLGGFFQYPNTMGIIMAAFLLFSTLMLLEEFSSFKHSLLFTVPSVFYSASLIASGSRGAVLIVVFVWILSAFFLSVKKQAYYFTYSFIFILAGVINYILLNQLGGPLSIALICLVSIGAGWFIYALRNQLHKLEPLKGRNLQYAMPGFLCLMVILLLLDLVNKGLLFSLFPIEVQDRLSELGTLTERTVIAKDALKAFLDSPIVGFGGEGWSAIFTNYQSLPYQTKNLHNGYLEWLIQSGIIGLFAFIGVFSFFIFKIIKNYLHEKGLPYIAVLAAILVVFIHSMMDFNFSFGVVWFILLWFIVIGLNPTSNEKSLKGLQLYGRISVSIIALICIVFSYRLVLSDQEYEKALSVDSVEERNQYVLKSVQLDKNNIDKWNALGIVQLEQYQNTKSQQEQLKIIGIVNEMISLEPKNSLVYEYGINLLTQAGLTNEANELINKGLEIDHYNTHFYTQSILFKTNLSLSLKEEKSGNEYEAPAKSAIETFQTMQKWKSEFYEGTPKGNRAAFNSRDFQVKDELRYLTALSHSVLGEYQQSLKLVKNLNSGQNHELQVKVDALRLVSYEKIGQKVEVEQILNKYKENKEFDLIYEELIRKLS